VKLSNYISDLLYRYECVIVPEFGGFVMNATSAIISKYSQTFYPPFKQITYNNHLKSNDGLLANYIASVDKIPFKCAMNFIKFEVSKWLEDLNQSDVFLENIGKFSLDDNDNIIFEPQTEINYLTSAYGLSSFVSPEINREPFNSHKEHFEIKTPVLTVKREKVSPNYLKYAAVLAIGVSLIAIGGNSLYNYYKNTEQLSVAKEQQKQIENKIEQATFIVTEALPSITLNASVEKLSYHVIAGAFRYPENAIRKVNYLKAKGYKARILGVNQWGLTQVSFDSYSTRDEALRNLYKVRINEAKDAWLLVQEL
jgi:hypothetical protein